MKIIVRAATVLVCVTALVSRARASEWRVPRDFVEIDAALAAAAPGDVIRVDPGVYAGPVDFRGKSVHVISSEGPDATVIDAAGNGSAVLFRNGEDRNAILEGFRLTGGTGTVLVVPRYGGGVFVQSASPTLRGNWIDTNTATLGGGFACVSGSNPLIEDNRFTRNGSIHGHSKPTAGGAIYIEDSSAEIFDNHIEDNAAKALGGGVAAVGSNVTLERCRFLHNHADANFGNGGAFGSTEGGFSFLMQNEIHDNGASVGAGIYVGDGAAASVLDNEVHDNVAGAAGGGVAFVFVDDATIRGSLIESNRAIQGGGVFCEAAEVRVLDSRILGHRQSAGEGAGIACVRRSDLTVENTTLADNSCRAGGAIWTSEDSVVQVFRSRFLRNVAYGDGGALFGLDSTVEIVGCALVGNSTRRGRGAGLLLALSRAWIASSTITSNEANAPNPEVATGGGIYSEDSELHVHNSIVWGNRADVSPQIARFAGDVEVTHSLVESGWPGPGNFTGDPGFAKLAEGSVALRAGSPCVDRGDPSAFPLEITDLDGDPRVLDGDLDGSDALDIGADELRPEIVARFGGVNAARGDLFDTLRVDGSAGDSERVLEIDRRDAFKVEMLPPPAGPSPARFVLYAWRTEPDATTLTPMPRGLGWSVLPTPLTHGADSRPATIWNNLGHRASLGAPERYSEPAPWVVADIANGAPFEVTVTLQGLIEDAGSIADGPLSRTNAIVIRITDRAP